MRNQWGNHRDLHRLVDLNGKATKKKTSAPSHLRSQCPVPIPIPIPILMGREIMHQRLWAMIFNPHRRKDQGVWSAMPHKQEISSLLAFVWIIYHHPSCTSTAIVRIYEDVSMLILIFLSISFMGGVQLLLRCQDFHTL
jgi:hypothetical protein